MEGLSCVFVLGFRVRCRCVAVADDVVRCLDYLRGGEKGFIRALRGE